jgi:hypothetical protein
MEELTLERADAAVSAMHEALSDAPDLSERLGLWDKDLRSRFNAFAVGFCVFKYIDSELDCHSLSDGALGRMSTEIPRLGAYCRKPLSRLSLPERRDLYRLIEDLMLRGYLTRALLLEAPPKHPVLTDAADLYERWVGGLCSSNPSEMDLELRAVLATVTDSAFVALNAFLGRYGIRGGGVLVEDKTHAISMHYPVCGFAVRTSEVGDLS